MPRHIHIIASVVVALCAISCGHGSQLPTAGTAESVDYPVIGVDVSAHNGDIDFETLANSGVQFVMMKASEGVSLKDSRFHHNYLAARRAGLKVGAYHFFRFDCTGYMQGLNLLHSVRGKDIDLPLVIDVEEWSNAVTQPTEGIVEKLKQMIAYVEAHGYKVMLYTNKNGYERFIRGRLESYPVWLCSFSPIDDSHRCVMWQYSHNGALDGVKGPVDLNAFRGTEEEWQSWCDSAVQRRPAQRR